MFQIETNCSNLKLVKLPTKVPHATGYLDVSYNQIKSISELKDDSYCCLHSLNLTGNKIKTLSPLATKDFSINIPMKMDFQNNDLSTVSDLTDLLKKVSVRKGLR